MIWNSRSSRRRHFAFEDLWAGFTRFSQGFKKLLIADPVGRLADQIFGADPFGLGFGLAWTGLLCFTLQIYFDFSGYTDMAIGLARMLGFRLRENFNTPYIAQSLSEFWQRWHISLTSWIRDYLYIPLGGNRGQEFKTYRNLWICFLLSGLWHGASWNFVLWGAYNGLFLTLDRMFLKNALARCSPIVATAATVGIVMFGWAIFCSPTLNHLGGYVAALAGTTSSTVGITIEPDVQAAVVLGAILSLYRRQDCTGISMDVERCRWPYILAPGGYLVLYAVAQARAFAVPFQPFIYFRF
jgi:alginate O-acetyltransferase complex protein AlgI